jgi:hypothetical protein
MKSTRIALLAAAAFCAAAGSALAQASIDTNNDGKLTLPEFLAGRAAPMMQRLDANKDGKITTAEMQAMRGPGGPNGQRPNGQGPSGPGPNGGPGQGGRGGPFAGMDANKDGAITRAELNAAMTTRFKAADANKDNALSLAEFQAMRGGGGGRN